MPRILSLALLVLLPLAAAAQNLSPNDYGLREAVSDTDRYWALYRTHAAAVEAGVDVDYSGISELHIAIPTGAKTIPLTRHSDFQGLRLHVLNNADHLFLFTRNPSAQSVALDPAMVDSGDFSAVPELARGSWLLILQDLTPWTERQGFGYKVYRNDLILIRDGRAENRPVFPYATPETKMKCAYCPADSDTTLLANLTLIRDKRSTFRTYMAYCGNIHNLLLRDLAVQTPKSTLVGDAVVSLRNCSHVTVRRMHVDGTYSKSGTGSGSGYGIMANNLYHSLFDSVMGNAPWGLFGTNNMSSTRLENCHINRFDIHCYGRDVYCRNCYFHTKQTQFSSLVGTLRFDSCRFHDCVPVRIRSSYNAYTPFELVMRDCRFDATLQHRDLVAVMLLDSADNARPELRTKCLPNIDIQNLTVEVPIYLGHVNLFAVGDEVRLSEVLVFDHLESITVTGVRMRHHGRRSRATLRPFAVPLNLARPCRTTIGLED